MSARSILGMVVALSVQLGAMANVPPPNPVALSEKAPVESREAVIERMRAELVEARAKLASTQTDAYEIQREYSARYYRYLADKADVSIEQFRWQQRASEFLLWLVVVVVFSGVAFSGIQLWRAGSTAGLIGESTIEIEARRVKVTSSVVGVMVLAISIVFFYFFLIEVYRINVVSLAPAEVQPKDLLPKTD